MFEHNFFILNLVIPSIIPFSYDEIVNVGDSLSLYCQIHKGDKPIVIKWSFRGFDDSHGIKIITNRVSDKSSLLSISNATASHSGSYTCTATNSGGTSSYSTNITVNGKESDVKSNIRYRLKFWLKQFKTVNKLMRLTFTSSSKHTQKKQNTTHPAQILTLLHRNMLWQI